MIFLKLLFLFGWGCAPFLLPRHAFAIPCTLEYENLNKSNGRSTPVNGRENSGTTAEVVVAPAAAKDALSYALVKEAYKRDGLLIRHFAASLEFWITPLPFNDPALTFSELLGFSSDYLTQTDDSRRHCHYDEDGIFHFESPQQILNAFYMRWVSYFLQLGSRILELNAQSTPANFSSTISKK